MDEPGLHGDERILIRTAGVHVKSISFDAILTNKRIILMDRLKNTTPPKEIPLATIQAIEAGENAIRETTITLSAVTKNGRTRQMVLTFSGEGRGIRTKERNEWIRLLKANMAFPTEPVTQSGIPNMNSTQKTGSVPPPGVENVGFAILPRPAASYEIEKSPQVKKFVASPHSASWQAPAVSAAVHAPAPVSILGTYCTRCGTKVPKGSGFCHMCGSRIIAP